MYKPLLLQPVPPIPPRKKNTRSTQRWVYTEVRIKPLYTVTVCKWKWDRERDERSRRQKPTLPGGTYCAFRETATHRRTRGTVRS